LYGQFDGTRGRPHVVQANRSSLGLGDNLLGDNQYIFIPKTDALASASIAD
jgi:hypothetical protein